MRGPASSSVSLIQHLPRKFPSPKFHPRGLVIGPNGLALCFQPAGVQENPTLRLGGQILVFDPETFDFLGVFIDDPNVAGEVGHLNRPDALVFSPDGKLYITSFRANPMTAIPSASMTGTPVSFSTKSTCTRPPSPKSNARAFAQSYPLWSGRKALRSDLRRRPQHRRAEFVGTTCNQGIRRVRRSRFPAAPVPHLRQNQSRNARLRRRRPSRRAQARLTLSRSAGGRQKQELAGRPEHPRSQPDRQDLGLHLQRLG